MPARLLFFAFAVVFPVGAVLAEKIILTGNREYPPLVFLENGSAKGIYPDMIRAMNAEGLGAEIRLTDWQAAQSAVLEGHADAVIGMAIIEERKKNFDFTDSLLAHEFAI